LFKNREINPQGGFLWKIAKGNYQPSKRKNEKIDNIDTMISFSPFGDCSIKRTKDGADVAEWRTLQRNGLGGYITIRPHQNITAILALYICAYALIIK